MSGNNNNISVGEQVRVVSGPHEGRGGTVTFIKDVIVSFSDPEPYAIVRYPDENSPGGVDEVTVPVRRLARRQ